MENWRELFDYSIIAMSDTKGDRRDSCLVNYKDSEHNVLSPVTNLMLNTVVKIFDSYQNLIINFPKKIFKTIPLIAYIFSEMKSKSVLVFTAGSINNKNDLIRIHNDNYYLLSTFNKWDNGANVLENCSMGYLKGQGELAFKFFLPHADSDYKQYLNENLDSILGNPNKSKIVLMGNSSFTSIIKTINQISIDNKDLKYENTQNNMDIDIGCIIFENADRYFSSKYNAEFFVKWLNENINPNIKIIFHFSNHDLHYLSLIKDLTKAKVISFNGGVIKNNDILVDSSLRYFENVKNLDIVGRYNLDDKNDYHQESSIILDDVKLYQGNLDYFTYNARKLTEFINDEEIGPNSLYYNAQKLFLDLNNLSINPSFLKFQIKYQGGFSYVSVPQFIELFDGSLQYESKNNRIYLKKYITLLNQFYQELSKRKRFFEENSYNRVGKDYRLLEIVKNKKEIFGNNNNLVIGTFFNTEPGILNNQLKDSSDVEAKFLGNLIKQYFDSNNSNLLLPGFVPPRFLAELYKDYSKIFVLNYDGFNRKNIEQQIKSIETPPITEETKVMDYFLELYDYLGMNKDNAFVKNYKKRLREWEKEQEKERERKEGGLQTGDTPVPDQLPIGEDGFRDVSEDDEEDYDDIVNIINKIENRLRNNQTTTYIPVKNPNPNQFLNIKTVDLELLNLGNNEYVEKTVPAKNKYLHFSDYGSLEDAFEIKSEDLSKDDYVIILDNDRVSFIDLFIEIFKLEENIDKNLADYWKDKLSIFVEENKLSYEEFHKLYKKEGGKVSEQTIKNWIRGNNIAPGDYQNDLVCLSKVMDDEFLLNNIDIMGEEFRKIKSLRIAMGLNLKSIMKSIIVEDFSLDTDLLSLEEQTMHNIIKNSVYKVVSVK